jgi:YHS domain-containing protein
MFDLNDLTKRIDQEIAAEVAHEKAVWADWMRWDRVRETRLRRHEVEARHIIELLKPRLDVFIERFKPVIKVEPAIHQHTSSVRLTFASRVAKVTLQFGVYPDQDVSHICVDCTQEIVPVLVSYDKQSSIQFPLGAVNDAALVQWFDDRIVAFVKAYIAVVRQDTALKEQLKDDFVEDPVARIRFPKYVAKSTLERDGQVFYFVDEETRREFEQQSAAPDGRAGNESFAVASKT